MLVGVVTAAATALALTPPPSLSEDPSKALDLWAGVVLPLLLPDAVPGAGVELPVLSLFDLPPLRPESHKICVKYVSKRLG